MIRALPLAVVTIYLLLIADLRPASAWVMMSVLPKGEVPENHCSKELADVLKKVRPIRGETMDGMSHYSCTLYYRGTQNDVQQLLDGLSKFENIPLLLNFDSTGKVGKLVSREVYPMDRPLHYLYKVSLSWNQLVDLGTVTPSPQPLAISVVVHSAGGIDPKELEIPDKFFDTALRGRRGKAVRAVRATADSNDQSE